MATILENATRDLPDTVERTLKEFVLAAEKAFGTALRSVVLYGSAAEGRLRATSDVNVVLVLRSFEQSSVDALREPLRIAEAAIRLAPMFLLDTEVAAAAEAFASKFGDIRRRHRVLHGEELFRDLSIPHKAAVARLRQVLLNMTLRQRALYALRSLREEQLAFVMADLAGPLRTAAATLVELEGGAPLPPKQALEHVAASFDGGGFAEPLRLLSEAREAHGLPPGAAATTLFGLIDLTERMRARADRLS